MSERREQRAAEALQRVGDRWTTMSGGVESRHAGKLATPTTATGPDASQHGPRPITVAGVAPGPLTIQCAKADNERVGQLANEACGRSGGERSYAASSAPFTTYGRKSPFWRWT